MEESFSARVPRSSAVVRKVFIHDIEEVEDVGQQEQQGDKKDDDDDDDDDDEGDEVKHEDDYGMNGDSNLSHSVRTSKQGRQSRDDDTN